MRAQEWDERYAEQQQWSAEPNALIAELLSGMPPGDAVDLAAGEGRHALWLAGLGWRVTAVDFSDRGLARGRAQQGADRVAWVTADVTTWSAAPASLDLVLVAYLHLPEAETTALLTGAVTWLRPGGRLLVLGHDVENLTAGVGGPQDRTILLDPEDVLASAAELPVDVELAQLRARDVPGAARPALDTVVLLRVRADDGS